MVSKAKEDFPEPLNPVITINLHGITPKTVEKNIRAVIEATMVAEETADYTVARPVLSAKEREKRIRQLEKALQCSLHQAYPFALKTAAHRKTRIPYNAAALLHKWYQRLKRIFTAM